MNEAIVLAAKEKMGARVNVATTCRAGIEAIMEPRVVTR